MQKITTGMWIGIVSTGVSLGALAWNVHSSSVKTHEEISEMKGTLNQLVKSVDNIEQSVLIHDRSIDNNSRRITYTQEYAEKTKKEIPKLKEAISVVKSRIQ